MDVEVKTKIFQHPDINRIVWTCDWVVEQEGRRIRHAQGGTAYEAIEEQDRQFLTWKTRAEAFKLATKAAQRHYEEYHSMGDTAPTKRPVGEPGQSLGGHHPTSYWGGKFGVMFWKERTPERFEVAGPFPTKTDAQVFGRRVAPFRFKLTTLHTPERYVERLEQLEREEGLREERRLRRMSRG